MAATLWANESRIAEQISELAVSLPELRYQNYAKQPTDDEIASLSDGNLEARIAAVIRLNDLYRDGYSPSAQIAGVAHYIHVTALPEAPVVNVPMVADVLRMMEYGQTQSQAVYALGGTN